MTKNANPYLEIYERVRSVPKSAQKDFDNGRFRGTDINPMWRIKTLTENFGIAGVGWYYDIIEHWSEQQLQEVAVHVRINLYVRDPETKEWSKPIQGLGGSTSIETTKKGPRCTDEAYKMALTDAIGVACKALGIGADIYWNNDESKYMYYNHQQAPSGYAQAPQPQYYQQAPAYTGSPASVAPPPANPPQAPPPQAPTNKQPPKQIQVYTPEQAIADLQSATSTEDLANKWQFWKAHFSKNAEVIAVIHNHPFNPNNKQ